MIGVLGRHDVREQPRPRLASVDRARRQIGGLDPFVRAPRAGVLRANVLSDEQGRRLELRLLAYLFADLLARTAAARAQELFGCRFMDDPLAARVGRRLDATGAARFLSLLLAPLTRLLESFLVIGSLIRVRRRDLRGALGEMQGKLVGVELLGAPSERALKQIRDARLELRQPGALAVQVLEQLRRALFERLVGSLGSLRAAPKGVVLTAQPFDLALKIRNAHAPKNRFSTESPPSAPEKIRTKSSVACTSHAVATVRRGAR